MTRNAGDHLKRHEVKAGIIEFILSKNEPVPEPLLRKHLEKTYRITDIKSIKKHLRELEQPGFSCIEKIPSRKAGKANNWEIRKMKHVKNIKCNFHKIQLKKYEKVLKIVTNWFFLSYPASPMTSMFRIQLLLSDSFFDMCIETDPKILEDRAYELYKHSFDNWGKENSEWEQRFLDDVCRGQAVEMFTIIMKDIPSQHKIPTDSEKLKITFEKIETEIKEAKSQVISYLHQLYKFGEALEIKHLRFIDPILIEKMFELCFQIDIMNGTVSPEEKEFVNITKEMRAHYKANPEISLLTQLQAYDDFYVQHFEKFRAKKENPQTSNSM